MNKTYDGVKLGLERAKTQFFEYNGQKYYAGTKFKMKNPDKYKEDTVTAIFKGYHDDDRNMINIAYNTKMDELTNPYLYGDGRMFRTGITVNREDIQNIVIEILHGNNYAELSKRKKYVSDMDDFTMISGWVKYLLAMFLIFFFNDRIFGWIVASVIFFVWRYKYKEKECVYYE